MSAPTRAACSAARFRCAFTLALLTTTIGLAAPTAAFAWQSAPQSREAEQAYKDGRHADAIRLTSNAIRRNSSDHAAWYLRGSSRVEAGRQTGDKKMIRDGIEDAREAIRLTSSSDSRYYLPYLFGMSSLAVVEKLPTHAETAIRIANGVIDSEDDAELKANLVYQRGRAWLVMEKLDEAEGDFQEALRGNRKLLAAWLALADTYQAKSDAKRARETFDEIVAEFPQNAMVRNNRGLFLQRQQDYAAAITDFTRAVELNKEFAIAFTNRGFTLMAMNDPEAAELDFNASLAINPAQPMVHRLRAGARLLQGRSADAVKDLNTAVKAVPNNPAVLADLGFARLINHDFSQAATTLKRVEALNPSMRHVRPWRFAAMVAGGRAATGRQDYAAELARVKSAPNECSWNDWLVASMAGELEPGQLLKIANSDPALAQGRLCEAHFFLGLQQELAAQTSNAAQHYQQSVDTKQTQLAAYRGALSSLSRMTQ